MQASCKHFEVPASGYPAEMSSDAKTRRHALQRGTRYIKNFSCGNGRETQC